MKIGDNIREIREKERNLKQEEVAKALGLSTKAYSNIENNVADITLTRLFELAEIFDVAPEYILNYKEKSTFTNHFNNYDGNNGVNIMYQGYTADLIKNVENQLSESKNRLETLKSNIKAKRN